MTTLAAGSVATLYLPGAQTLTFTPGTGGRISINGRNVDGSAITPQEIYTATSVAFRAGATVSVEAINVDCTYTDVADSGLTSSEVAWVQSSVLGGTPVTVAMVQANTPPPGGADGYCIISDGDGSVYPRGWRLYWLSSGPYYTLADIRSIDGKVS